MKLSYPDNLPDAIAMALVEAAEIILVWVIALEAYKLLDRIRLKFRPRDFWNWLQTPEGRFAEYVARDSRSDAATETDE